MKRSSITLVVVLGLVAGGIAQIRAGEASLSLNGTVSGGYSGDYSNYAGSEHNVAIGGAGSLTGFYYNPSFISFDIQPFYGQSRANSVNQSISASDGVSASGSLFSGSDFPGTIVYSKTFNSSGSYAVPGVADYTTHGNTEMFGVNWSVRRDPWPSLNVGFFDSNSGYSLYGTNSQGEMHTKMFDVSSGYKIAGFGLNAGFQHSGSNSLTPEVLAGTPSTESNLSSNSYSFGISHTLPLHGSFTTAANRVTLSSQAQLMQEKVTVNNLSSGVSFAPLKNLNIGTTANYTDNLQGSIDSSLIAAGVTSQNLLQQSSTMNSLTITGFASYDMPALNLHFRGFDDRQEQSSGGSAFISNSLNGNAMYSAAIFRGQFNSTIGVTHTTLNSNNESSTGLNGSIGYMRSIGHWDLNGALSYSQATQTLLASYTSSGYHYSGGAGRHLSKQTYWSASAAGSRSVLTDVPGSSNSSQSYSTSLALRKINLSGVYSKSNGNAILTAGGLVTTSVPLPALNPLDVIVFNGTAYSGSVGTTPIRGLTISASYAKAHSDTLNYGSSSSNDNQNLNFLLQYQLRKLNLTAGYVKLVQGFSLSGTPPTNIGSYYFGISRWIHLF